VWLPPGYEESHRRYPVVYFLAGFASRGTMLLNEALWEENLPRRLGRLTAAGIVAPLIAVMPDCSTRLGGSQYINSPATGRYEDFLVEELVPYVDSHFRTLPEPERRAVMGKSSGGYGATVLAMRHPDRFGLAADHSGDKGFDLCYRPDFPKCVAALDAYEHSAAKFLETFPQPPAARGRHWFDLVNMLAMASCYSPNANSPLGFDLPFDEFTCELREEVWKTWLGHDPVHLVEKHADALRSLRLYYLDCGRRDEYRLQYGARLYAERLREFDVRHRYEEFDGGHRGTSFRYDLSLRALCEAMA